MGEPPQRSAKQHAVKAGHHPLNLIPELRDKLLHWRFSLGPRLRIWSSNNVHLRRNASYCLCLASASAPASSMKNTKTQWHAKSNGVTIILPSETEAGSAGMQPCRGIAWWAHRDDDRAREFLSRSSLPSSDRKTPCLENPRPKGRNPAHEQERCLSVQCDQDNGVYPDRCSRKRRNLRQVESNERCCSSESQL